MKWVNEECSSSEGIIVHYEAQHGEEVKAAKGRPRLNVHLRQQLVRVSHTAHMEGHTLDAHFHGLTTATLHDERRLTITGSVSVLKDASFCKGKGSCCIHCQQLMKCKTQVIKNIIKYNE